MGICENAAYLKGLAEGLAIEESSKEGKLILKMLDVISDMAERIEILEDENAELYDYMEEMASDIIAMEDDLYDIDEDDFDDYSDLSSDDEDYEGDIEDYYEVECPSCGEKICFSEDVDLETLICPACNEPVGEIELCEGECKGCENADTCEAFTEEE